MSIDGIPNGYRLVRVGRAYLYDNFLDCDGDVDCWLESRPSEKKNFVIIEIVKNPKQYREPEISDFANGPIEIEACTPDPHTGERRWRKRKLVAIQTGGRKPFVVQHPNQPGLVVCYKEARIEVVASSEPAPQAEQVPDVKVTIYREPTQRDLANGPIRCRVRDSKESEWEILNLCAVLPERVEMRFVAIGDADSIATTWKYCEIPSDHQAIRVGDLVRVTARQVGVYREGWRHEMNRQVNKVAKVSGITHDGRFLLNGCGGWRFHRDWLELVETASEAKGDEA